MKKKPTTKSENGYQLLHHQKATTLGQSRPLSTFSSNHEQDQLSEILNTNRILVENKRHIYETKINSYQQKIGKIQQLMKTALDAEQKHSLYEKICIIEEKKKESQLKLHKIAKIEMEMMEVQDHNQPHLEQQDLNEWRIRTHSTNTKNEEKQKDKDHINKRANRSISINGNSKKIDHNKLFNKTCKPFVGMEAAFEQQYTEGDSINPLENSQFEVFTENQDNNDRMGESKMQYRPHSRTIYDQLASCSGKKKQMRLQFEENENQGKEKRNKNRNIIVKKEKQNIHLSPYNDNKMDSPSKKENKQKLPSLQSQIELKQNQLKFKQAKISIIETFTQISHLLSNSEELSPSELISAKQPLSFMKEINERLMKIKHSLQNQQLVEEQIKDNENELKRVREENKALGKQNQNLIEKQRDLLEEIDQLESIKENTFSSIIKNLEQTCTDLNIGEKRSVLNEKQKSHQIIQLFEAINKSIQIQKVTALERKESILSIQYKMNLLKTEEQKCKQKIEALKDSINEQQSKKRQLQKQNSRLAKDKESLSLETNRLSEQVNEFEDLSGIRKNCYHELEQKYSKLKSKKNKLEMVIKGLENEEKELKESTQRVGQLVDRNEKYLNKINEEIKNRRSEREELFKKLQQIDGCIGQKDEELKQISETVDRKKEMCKEYERNSLDLEQKILKQSQKFQNIQQNSHKFSQQISKKQGSLKELNKEVMKLAKEKSELEQNIVELQGRLEEQEKSFEELRNEIKQRQLNLKGMQKNVKNLQIKQEKLFEENQLLNEAKCELEGKIQSLREEMKIFEEDHKVLNLKNEQLQSIAQEKSKQIEQKNEQITKMNIEITKKQEQILKLAEQAVSAEQKLTQIIECIDFNRDEEQNILNRLKEIKKLQNRAILELAVRIYANSSGEKKQGDADLQEILKVAVNPEIKFQIEDILEEINSIGDLKERYSKQKQLNRKLKLDNGRLRKMCEIEEGMWE